MHSNRIIDIHCHASSKPFLSADPPKYNIFKPYSFTRHKKLRETIEFLSNVRNHTQSNFDNLYQGGVRVAFLSLTPVEKGFLKKSILNAVQYATLGRITEEEIVSSLTGFDDKILKFINSNAYNDYYKQSLLPEYVWLTAYADQPSPNGNYTVKFPKNFAELEANLNNDQFLNIILNVEGAHAFAMAPFETMLEHPYQYTTAELNQLCANINDIRINHPIPIFSIGLMHHFWNGLGGHAASLMNLIRNLKNQDIGLNTGLNESGKTVLREMVKKPDGQRSIIIDIKHMSPQARIDYYALRENESTLFKNSPVFCSHTGIAIFYETLAEWVEHEKEKIYGDCYLHEQSINLCQEDVLQIYNTKGILGLQLDEKRLFGKAALKAISKEIKQDAVKNATQYNSYQAAKYFWANIFACVDDLALKYKKIKPDFWNIFSIGSDFDGLINHLENCPEAASLPQFKDSLFAFLVHPEEITLFENKQKNIKLSVDRINELKAGLDNQTIIHKLFHTNAYEFLKRNFQ